MMYKIRATVRCNNLRPAYNKRYKQNITQRRNSGLPLQYSRTNVHSSMEKKHIELTSNTLHSYNSFRGLATVLWHIVVYQGHSQNTANARAHHGDTTFPSSSAFNFWIKMQKKLGTSFPGNF